MKNMTEIDMNQYKGRVPKGIFFGPRFIVEPRENHGMGYHTHLRIRKGGNYVRSGYEILSDGEGIYAIAHGNGGTTLFSLERKKKAVEKDTKKDISEMFRDIDPIQLAPVPKERTYLFNL